MIVPEMRTAISYVRWSTLSQLLGDSKRRQVEKTEAFCKEHGLILDQRLIDDGKSAYKGKHRQRGGALSRFLESVKAGKVPKGAILIVESLDRLSRETVPVALRQFLEILEHDIEIVTLIDRQWYSQKSLGADSAPLLMSIVYMMRAHDESRHKAERLAEVWQHKRKRAVESGEPMTSACPGWLRLRKDGKGFEVIPERAKLVRLMFWLYNRGWSRQRIVALFNRHSVPTWGVGRKAAKGWHHSYIQKTLNNRAVLGEFVPHSTRGTTGAAPRQPAAATIKDYYPRVIPDAAFAKVQLRSTGPRGPIGPRVANLFQGLLRDGDNPEFTMYYKDHGDKEGKWRYVCSDFRRLHPDEAQFSWNYNALERLILNYLCDLDWSILTVDKDIEVRRLRDDLAVLEAKLKRMDSEARGLVDLAKLASGIAEVAEQLKALEETRAELRKQASRLRSELKAKQGFTAEDGVRVLRQLAADRGNVANRYRLREAIRQYVRRIELYRSVPRQLTANMQLPRKKGVAWEEMLHARCVRLVFVNGAERWIVDRPVPMRFDGAKLPPKGRLEINRDEMGGKVLEDAAKARPKPVNLMEWKRRRKR